MLAARVKTWTEQWKQEGVEQGLREGLQQGIGQGLQRGEAIVLRRLMIHRFSPLPEWVDPRLEQASTAQLETWVDRVLHGSH
jgi:flagellar biosynthesis/type III secretory pathway protein FliH